MSNLQAKLLTLRAHSMKLFFDKFSRTPIDEIVVGIAEAIFRKYVSNSEIHNVHVKRKIVLIRNISAIKLNFEMMGYLQRIGKN